VLPEPVASGFPQESMVMLIVFDAGTIGTTGTVVLVEFDAGTTGEVLFLISGPIGCVGLRYGIAGC